MQNLTAEEKNLMCGLCLQSPVYYSTIMPYVLISMPANGWVLWLMISSPVFWTNRMEVFGFHLVLTEMLFGFLGPPLLTIRHFIFDYEVADIVTKLINIMFMARIQFQNCVCIERYVAVRRPILYCRYKPLRYRMSLCCVVWLQAILVGIPQMLFCTGQQQSLLIYRAYFLIVFIMNSFCCLSVQRALKQPSPGEGEREGSNLFKNKAFNIVLMFQVTVFIGYLPLATMYLLPLAYSVMVWIGLIHPLLYLQRAGKHLVRKDVCVNCVQV